jgi:hypothetical protein
MVVIEERSNPRKRRRTIEPVTKLRLPAAKKSRSSLNLHTKSNQNVGLGQPDRTSIYHSFIPQCRSYYVGKWGRTAEDEEPPERTRKSPRLQENRWYFYILALVLSVHCQCHLPSVANKRRCDAENRVQPQPYRKSPRLQDKRHLNRQKLEHTEEPTRSSLGPIKTHHGVGEEEAQAGCKILRAPKDC